jgi:hypothetical protein
LLCWPFQVEIYKHINHLESVFSLNEKFYGMLEEAVFVGEEIVEEECAREMGE